MPRFGSAALDRPQVGLARYEESPRPNWAQGLGGADETPVRQDRGAPAPSCRPAAMAAATRPMTMNKTPTSSASSTAAKACPSALAILLIHAAESVGWRVVGLSFPFHFLVRLDHENERVVLDPFKGAITLNTQQMRDSPKVLRCRCRLATGALSAGRQTRHPATPPKQHEIARRPAAAL